MRWLWRKRCYFISYIAITPDSHWFGRASVEPDGPIGPIRDTADLENAEAVLLSANLGATRVIVTNWRRFDR